MTNMYSGKPFVWERLSKLPWPGFDISLTVSAYLENICFCLLFLPLPLHNIVLWTFEDILIVWMLFVVLLLEALLLTSLCQIWSTP